MMAINDYPADSFFRDALAEGSIIGPPILQPPGEYNQVGVDATKRIVSVTGGANKQTNAQRVTTGSIGASATIAVVLTWSVPFADANYTPIAAVLDSTGNLVVVDVSAYDAATLTVNVKNNDAVNPHTGTLLAIAIHD